LIKGEREMLEQDKINEYTRLLKECEEAKQEAQKINTEISMLKKQGMEKLQEKGYKSLSEASKIDEEIAKIEKEIEEEIPKMREYIATVNEKREEKERILMG
jgi:predicted  nucleic acid-binding Zn-ribbon protein